MTSLDIVADLQRFGLERFHCDTLYVSHAYVCVYTCTYVPGFHLGDEGGIPPYIFIV